MEPEVQLAFGTGLIRERVELGAVAGQVLVASIKLEEKQVSHTSN